MLKMVTKSEFQVISCTENGDNRKGVEKVDLKKTTHFWMLLCNLVIWFLQILILQNLSGPPSECQTPDDESWVVNTDAQM